MERIDALRRYLVQELIRDPDIELAHDEAIFSSGLLDSFSVTRLITFLEDEYRVRVPIAQVTLQDFDTMDLILALVSRLESTPA